MEDTGGKSLASFGLCLNARKAVVDKQNGADPSLPGPGQYVNPITEGRNANGEVKATLSSQKNVPSVRFNSEGRHQRGRPIEKQLNSADTMGPTYNLDNVTCGRQVQSRLRTAPSATFGSGPQRYHGSSDFKTRATEPSPQHYETANLTSAVHRLSTQPSIPGTKFMTGPRTYNDVNAREARKLPAPGQYNSQPALGRQVESRYRGGYEFSFHGGRRDFVRSHAAEEPGPGHYINPATEGRNAVGEAKAVLSNQRSYPSVVFAKATRPKSAPGMMSRHAGPPSHYDLPSALGRQPNSRYRSQPSVSFGAR